MKYILSFLFLAFACSYGFSQIPQGINYQGVAYNVTGNVLANQSIGIEFAILDGSTTGTPVYVEGHTTTTDPTGHFALVIGQGTPSLGTFNGINWAVGGGKFLQVGMDATGGSSYTTIGTSQLLSVPYALYAGSVLNSGGKHILSLADDVTDAQAATIIQNEVGPNTQIVVITNTFNLTTVDLSSLTSLISILVQDNSALTTVNMSGVTRCDGNLIIENCPALTSLDMSSLKKQNGSSNDFLIKQTGLTNLNLPLLEKAYGEFLVNQNSSLTTITAPLLEYTKKFQVNNNSTLTSMDFSMLNTIDDRLDLKNNGALATVTFPGLTNIGFHSDILNNNSLTTVNFPALLTSYGLNLSYNPVLTTVTAPLLTNSTAVLNFYDDPLLSSLSFPSLLTTTQIDIWSLNAMTTFSAPILTTIDFEVSISGVSSLTTVDFSSLTTISAPGCVFSVGGASLANLTLPALTSLGNGNGSVIQIYGALPVADVNSLLITLASLSPALTNAQIGLNQNPAAAPSGAGATAKTTLINNGNNVMTD